VDLGGLRADIERRRRRSPDAPLTEPGMKTTAKDMILYAIQEAESLNHGYVGTEHLLLGLIRDRSGGLAPLFAKFGVEIEDARKAILAVLGDNTSELAKSRVAVMAAEAEPRPLEPLIQSLIRSMDTVVRGLEREKEAGVREADYERAKATQDRILEIQAKS